MLQNIKQSPEKVKELAFNSIASRRYQCAESIVLAFSEVLGFPADLRYVSGFGGGLGDTKCVCGAYNGSVVVLNLLYGNDKREERDESLIYGTYKALDRAIQKFEQAFKATYKTACCKVLTRDVEWHSPAHGEHCANLTANTAEILWNVLQEIEAERATA